MSEQFGYNTNIGDKIVFVQLNPFDKEVIQKYCATIEPPNCYLEIGTDMGGSALVARGATKADIYTIDFRSIAPKIPEINYINGRSVLIAESWGGQPIGVLFIDGNHTEAKYDFLAWEKYVVKGGYIIFHDYIQDPTFTVIKDCDELFENNDNYEIIYKPLDLENTRCFIVKKK